MRERETRRMQPLPGQAELCGQRRVCAIGKVADARMPQRRHVHPDLMGAAGLKLDLEQARHCMRFEGLVVGDARLATGDDSEPELVLRDVVEGRVSLAAAEADYGVVFEDAGAADQYVIDEAATKRRRAEMAKARNTPLPMIDRGEGYEKMLRGEHRPRMR